MDMNEEYGLTPYETREILFYKTVMVKFGLKSFYIRKTCG